MITGKYLSDDWKTQRDRVLLGWLNNDKEAFDLLMLFNDCAELWDDLIDNDKKITQENINTVFTELLVKYPNNPFYIKHRAFLTPLIISAIISWRSANSLEQGTRSERAVAYTLRSIDLNLLSMMIYIIRGHAAAVALTPEIWRTFVSRNDSIDEYLDTYLEAIKDVA